MDVNTPAARGGDLVVVSEILPDKLHILPVEPRPVFPHVMLPLSFSGPKAVELIKKAWESEDRLLGAVLIKDRHSEDYFASELYEVGTVLKLYRMQQPDENVIQVLARGLQRFSRVRSLPGPLPRWEVRYHYDPQLPADNALKPYAVAMMANVRDLMRSNPLMQEPVKMMLSQLSSDNQLELMDVVAALLGSEPAKLQDLLETFELIPRAEKVLLLLKEELELMSLQEKIQQQIQEKVSKQQKEFFLREQLKAIKQELGLEKDGKAAEIEKIESRLKERQLSDEAAKVVHEELDKLQQMDPHAPEYHVTRNYLDALTELPWGIYSRDNLNLRQARRILNQHHYGLDDVKERILEFISTLKKRGKLSGSIICLVGPPGVGKTSIGRSIAEALNRDFYRFSVGGMRDEAEIKGHRRTYIGAMPGKLIQALKRTGTANPLIMLDEIDKIGVGFRGDPASALLEVLDPEQNAQFLDHYLDVRFDLSRVMFVTTANQLDTIPAPLLDRMEIIRLSGYIQQEKVQIARRHLLPRQLEAHGLDVEEVQISDGALQQIAERYAREAGVRNLENQLKKLLRKVTLQWAEKQAGPFKITVRNLESYLGKAPFLPQELYETALPGVTLGLAWTALGGAILHIEANAVAAKSGSFQQTGQLGDVMKESAQIAYTYVRAMLGQRQDKAAKAALAFFDKHQVHLHVPEGATPKDGPSAGITMALALYSLATGQPIARRLGMTGELTLTGKVLPIGGVREKVIAARRVKMPELILPKANQRDFEDLPDYLREGLRVHFVGYFDEVLAIALKADDTAAG